MLITTLLYLIFVLSALLLILVVLIQEGKGGGLGDAFGGAGQQTFGVGASGITKFTSYVAGVFLVTAVLITLRGRQAGTSILDDLGDVPAGGQFLPGSPDPARGSEPGALPVTGPAGGAPEGKPK